MASLALIAAAGAWASEPCYRMRLSHSDLKFATSAAQTAARFPIDPKSSNTCHIGKFRFVNFETVRQLQGDGTQTWEAVACDRNPGKDWRCSARPQRAVGFEPHPGAGRSWVNIPLEMDAEQSRHIIAEAYPKIVSMEQRQACSQSTATSTDRYANFRRSFLDEAVGELSLMPEELVRSQGKGLVLMRGDFIVVLARTSETDPEWRVVCWEELEYL